MIKICIGILFPIITIFYSSTWADTTLVYSETSDRSITKADRILYISNGNIRIDNKGDIDSYIIFDSKTSTMTTINHRDRSYVNVNEETIAEISNTFTDAQKQALARMENRFKTLSPEKQEQMRSVIENVMKRSTPSGGKPEPIRHIPLRRTLAVDGYRCKIIETYKGKSKKSELCIVNRKKLGIVNEDYETLQDFYMFMQEMATRMRGGGQYARNLDFGYSKRGQIPVQIIRFKDDGSFSRHQLGRISNDSIARDKFILPSGYRERRLSR